MNAIVAVDRNWAIGRDNGLLFSLPGDMKHFRTLTTGGTVIMGRKTLDSFPGGRPLPKRRNIVITRSPDLHREGWTAPYRMPTPFSPIWTPSLIGKLSGPARPSRKMA